MSGLGVAALELGVGADIVGLALDIAALVLGLVPCLQRPVGRSVALNAFVDACDQARLQHW